MHQEDRICTKKEFVHNKKKEYVNVVCICKRVSKEYAQVTLEHLGEIPTLADERALQMRGICFIRCQT